MEQDRAPYVLLYQSELAGPTVSELRNRGEPHQPYDYAERLTVKARLDRQSYMTGRKVTDAELQALRLTRHALHPHLELHHRTPSRRSGTRYCSKVNLIYRQILWSTTSWSMTFC